MFSNVFSENRAGYEIMWKNIVEWDSPRMTIWRMRMAYWVPKATNTHSQYVLLIAFPLQQWLHERSSMKRYTNIACLVLWRLCFESLSVHVRFFVDKVAQGQIPFRVLRVRLELCYYRTTHF